MAVKNKIDELAVVLGETEGIDMDPGLLQDLKNLQYRWRWADIEFNAAFYSLLRYGPDDVPTMSPAISDLRDAFEKLETCCKEWKDCLGSLLPPVEKGEVG